MEVREEWIKKLKYTKCCNGACLSASRGTGEGFLILPWKLEGYVFEVTSELEFKVEREGACQGRGICW